MSKEVLTAKVSSQTLRRLEEYADELGISKSEAADRMIKQGLDVEESDMRLVPLRSDGGTVIEDELEGLQSEVDNLNGQFQQSTRLSYFLLVSIIWIGLQVTVGLPSWFVLTSGPLMMFVLIYYMVKEVTK